MSNQNQPGQQNQNPGQKPGQQQDPNRQGQTPQRDR